MIVGERVTLGPLDSRHAELTRHWMNDPDLSLLLGRRRPITDTEHAHWFAQLSGRKDCAYFAICCRTTGEHIGNIWLWNIESQHGKAELRVVIGRETHLGKGLGTEAIDLACEFAFQRLNLRKVFAMVLDINPRARRAFEKAHFHEEAILREDRWVGSKYANVYILARFRHDSCVVS